MARDTLLPSQVRLVLTNEPIADGKLYLFGSGNWGVLGQGNEKDARFDHPQLVDYFTKRQIKVVDVALGEYHSVALAEDGSVYTWGYGGKTGMFNWMYT